MQIEQPVEVKVPRLSQLRSDLLRLYAAAIQAVDAQIVTQSALTQPLAEISSLAASSCSIRAIAVGKAAAGMAAAASRIFSAKICDSLIIVPKGTALPPLPPAFRVMQAAHPLPDASSEAAGRAALDFVRRSGSDDVVLLLLSGGASSLMTVPAEGVTLADKVAITAGLMRTGTPIGELNSVRKHLSAIKGGGLLRASTSGAKMVTLMLSDVPSNDPATIGSGPTVADPTTFAEAIGVLKRRKLWGRTPEAVRDRLERGAANELPETLKPRDPLLARALSLIIGDIEMALDGIAATAREIGYDVEVVAPLRGEAEEVGRKLGAYLKQASSRRLCVIAGGEPVVTVTGSGRGGRAQHCALAFAIALGTEVGNTQVLALFAGTDGVDGPTDAAGAIVSSATVRRAGEAGLDLHAALRRCDSYNVFAALGDLMITGPTGTNVGDVFIGLINR
jgi:glycerate-2-kinase